MKQVTWLGDDDTSVRQITQFGHTFVVGVSTDVETDSTHMLAFENNPYFSVEGDDEPDTDQEGEVATVKAELDAYGVKYRSNASLESLRKLLAGADD